MSPKEEPSRPIILEPLQPPVTRTNHTARRTFVIIAVLGLLVLIVALFSPTEENGKWDIENSIIYEGPPEAEKLEVINARDVLAYYDKNEIRGDRNFKGKWFAVRGRVDIISKVSGIPCLALYCGESTFFSVQCLFSQDHEDILAELRPGMTVTIGGQCRGKRGNVLMTHCFFHHPQSQGK